MYTVRWEIMHIGWHTMWVNDADRQMNKRLAARQLLEQYLYLYF
jgi:hypothetical protein